MEEVGSLQQDYPSSPSFEEFLTRTAEQGVRRGVAEAPARVKDELHVISNDSPNQSSAHPPNHTSNTSARDYTKLADAYARARARLLRSLAQRAEIYHEPPMTGPADLPADAPGNDAAASWMPGLVRVRGARVAPSMAGRERWRDERRADR
jgi:hypothetical protein